MGTLVRLPRKFFNRPTLKVARELLGCVLVVRRGRHLQRGIIIETEAYVGPYDLASHASRGRTPRTELMFGDPGYLYVYLIYGLHYCMNVVTERAGYPAAVLIRSIYPLGEANATGIGNSVKMVRPDHFNTKSIIAGPGRVCRYFGIAKRDNGYDAVMGHRLWFEHGVDIPPRSVQRSPRIGVDYAGAWRHKPWRFAVVQN